MNFFLILNYSRNNFMPRVLEKRFLLLSHRMQMDPSLPPFSSPLFLAPPSPVMSLSVPFLSRQPSSALVLLAAQKREPIKRWSTPSQGLAGPGPSLVLAGDGHVGTDLGRGPSQPQGFSGGTPTPTPTPVHLWALIILPKHFYLVKLLFSKFNKYKIICLNWT